MQVLLLQPRGVTKALGTGDLVSSVGRFDSDLPDKFYLGVPQMAIWTCFGDRRSQVRILLPRPATTRVRLLYKALPIGGRKW